MQANGQTDGQSWIHRILCQSSNYWVCENISWFVTYEFKSCRSILGCIFQSLVLQMCRCIWNLCNKKFSKKNHQSCSTKKVVLKNFAIFTGKHLCQSLLIKLEAFSHTYSSHTPYILQPSGPHNPRYLSFFE